MHVFNCFIIFVLKVTYEKEPCFILTFNKLFLRDFFFIRREILMGTPRPLGRGHRVVSDIFK